MKINLGSGRTKIEGYVNVDHEKFEGVDYVAKIGDLHFAKDGEVEAIYASNVLEHEPYYRIPIVLDEWARVMKPGGKVYISVPDMVAINEYIIKNGWDDWICYIVYGGSVQYPDVHSSGFDLPMITKYLESAGFHQVYRVDKFPQGLIDCSQCTARDGLENKTNLIVLNVIAEKI